MGGLQEWACLEVGCDYVAVSEDEDALVAAAMDHARAVHGSFELEEMILAAFAARDPASVPADFVVVAGVRAAPLWAATHDPARLSPDGKRSMEWSPERGYADL